MLKIGQCLPKLSTNNIVGLFLTDSVHIILFTKVLQLITLVNDIICIYSSLFSFSANVQLIVVCMVKIRHGTSSNYYTNQLL